MHLHPPRFLCFLLALLTVAAGCVPQSDAAVDDDDASDEDESESYCFAILEVRYEGQLVQSGTTVNGSDALDVDGDGSIDLDFVATVFDEPGLPSSPTIEITASNNTARIETVPFATNGLAAEEPAAFGFDVLPANPSEPFSFTFILTLPECAGPLFEASVETARTCGRTTTVFFEGVAIDSGSDIDALSVADEDDDGGHEVEFELQNDEPTPFDPPLIVLVPGDHVGGAELDPAPAIDPIGPGERRSFGVDVVGDGLGNPALDLELKVNGCEEPFFTWTMIVHPPDADGDGVTIDDGDCNDGDANVFPGAVELPSDSIDNDCNGIIGTDAIEGDCDDGVDFDLDGQLDCDDPDCAGDPACGGCADVVVDTPGFNVASGSFGDLPTDYEVVGQPGESCLQFGIFPADGATWSDAELNASDTCGGPSTRVGLPGPGLTIIQLDVEFGESAIVSFEASSGGDFEVDLLAITPSQPNADLGSSTGASVGSGSTYDATGDSMYNACASARPDYEFSWTAPSTATWTFTATDPTGDDVDLSVMPDSNCRSVPALGCIANQAGVATVAVALEAGQQVLIGVAGYGGEFTLGIQ